MNGHGDILGQWGVGISACQLSLQGGVKPLMENGQKRSIIPAILWCSGTELDEVFGLDLAEGAVQKCLDPHWKTSRICKSRTMKLSPVDHCPTPLRPSPFPVSKDVRNTLLVLSSTHHVGKRRRILDRNPRNHQISLRVPPYCGVVEGKWLGPVDWLTLMQLLVGSLQGH